MAISKNKIKQITALHLKKNRLEQGLFIVEGEKTVSELLHQNRYSIQSIYAIAPWISENKLPTGKTEICEVSPADLSRISTLKSPNKVLAIVAMPEQSTPVKLDNQLCLVLDNLQDPGNLGTIIRIADWFGIAHIFCSMDSVETFNPKVLQASMGSFLRVQVHYTNLPELFRQFPNKLRYGALLEGQDIRSSALNTDAFLLIGNEGKGLSDEILPWITDSISIPRFGAAESLNAAVATGILSAMFKL